MITLKIIEKKDLSLEEVILNIYNGKKEMAMLQSLKGFGVLAKIKRSECLIFITDNGLYSVSYDEASEWLSNWEFVEYTTYKDL